MGRALTDDEVFGAPDMGAVARAVDLATRQGIGMHQRLLSTAGAGRAMSDEEVFGAPTTEVGAAEGGARGIRAMLPAASKAIGMPIYGGATVAERGANLFRDQPSTALTDLVAQLLLDPSQRQLDVLGPQQGEQFTPAADVLYKGTEGLGKMAGDLSTGGIPAAGVRGAQASVPAATSIAGELTRRLTPEALAVSPMAAQAGSERTRAASAAGVSSPVAVISGLLDALNAELGGVAPLSFGSSLPGAVRRGTSRAVQGGAIGATSAEAGRGAQNLLQAATGEGQQQPFSPVEAGASALPAAVLAALLGGRTPPAGRAPDRASMGYTPDKFSLAPQDGPAPPPGGPTTMDPASIARAVQDALFRSAEAPTPPEGMGLVPKGDFVNAGPFQGAPEAQAAARATPTIESLIRSTLSLAEMDRPKPAEAPMGEFRVTPKRGTDRLADTAPLAAEARAPLQDTPQLDAMLGLERPAPTRGADGEPVRNDFPGRTPEAEAAFRVAEAQRGRKVGALDEANLRGDQRDLRDLRAGGTTTPEGTAATKPETFTFYGAKVRDGQMTDGDRVERVGEPYMARVGGKDVELQTVRFVDRQGAPEMPVPTKGLKDLQRPANPRYAQDVAADLKRPQQGVGTDTLSKTETGAPRESVQRVGAKSQYGQFIPGERQPTRTPAPRAGQDVTDASLGRIEQKPYSPALPHTRAEAVRGPDTHPALEDRTAVEPTPGRWKVNREGKVTPAAKDATAFRGEMVLDRNAKGEVSVVHAAPDLKAGERNGLVAAVRRHAKEQDARVPLTDDQRYYLEGLRSDIGWAEQGGRLIRAADTGGEKPEVVGRTSWIEKSSFWPNRPPGISERQAHKAIDRAMKGEPLNASEKRFVEYARDYLQRELDHQREADAQYAERTKGADPMQTEAEQRYREKQAADEAVVDDAIREYHATGKWPGWADDATVSKAEDKLERQAIAEDPPRDDADFWIPYDEQRDSADNLPPFARGELDGQTPGVREGESATPPADTSQAQPGHAGDPAGGGGHDGRAAGAVGAEGARVEPPRPAEKRVDGVPGRPDGNSGGDGGILRTHDARELADRRAAAERESRRVADEQRQADERAQADQQRGSFELTGSNRPADANPRQGDLVDMLKRQDLAPLKKGGDEGPGTLFSNPIVPMLRPIVRALGDVFRSLDTPEAKELRRSIFNIGKSDEKRPGNPFVHFVKVLGWSDASVVDSVGRNNKSPVLQQIARMFSDTVSNTGKSEAAVGETFEAEVRNRSTRNMNATWDALQHVPENEWGRVVALLENRGKIGDTPVGRAARALATLLDEEHAHLRAAGVDVGNIRNYFPRVYDAAMILRDGNLAGFRAAAEKAYRAVGLKDAEAHTAAEEWVTAFRYRADNIPDVPFLDMGQEAPQKSFTKHREFTPEVMKASGLDGYLVRDPLTTLTEYFHRTARRASFERRFGGETSDGLQYAKWREMRTQLEAEGNGHLIEWAESRISAMMGNVGGTRGMLSTPKAREYGSMVRALTIATFLKRAVISSLTEPIQAFNRTAAQGWDTATANMVKMYYNGFRDLGSFMLGRDLAPDRQDAWRTAEVIGALMNNRMQSEAMAHRYDHADIYQSKGWAGRNADRLSNAAMRATGLHTWTSANRADSAMIGRSFLDAMAEDATTGDKSKLASYELERVGIGADRLQAFAKFAGKGLSIDGVVAAARKGDEGAKAYLEALNRFVDQVIMDPKSADKPYLAKHPFAGLMYNLQSWMYSYWYNVQKPNLAQARRALTEQGFTGGERLRMLSAPAISTALTYVLVSQLLTATRDLFSGKNKDQEFKKGQEARILGMPVKMIRDLSQAQMFGLFDPWVNMATGARYGRQPEAALSGAMLSRGTTAAREAVLAVSDKNSPKTNTQERKLAASAYDLVVDPFLSVTAAMAPGARFLTPLTQRDELKQAFVDATAGPQRARGGVSGGF